MAIGYVFAMITANSLCLYGRILTNCFAFCKSAAILLLRKQRCMLSNLPLALLWHGISSSLALALTGRSWTRCGPENGLAASTVFCAFGQFFTARFCSQGCSSRKWVCGQHCSFDFILKAWLNFQVFFCWLSNRLPMSRGCAPAKYHLKLPPRHTLSPNVTPF